MIKKLLPIRVAFGKSTFLRREAVERMIDIELAGGERGMNLSRFDGPECSAADVLDDVRTYSLLGDRRVVVVDDANAFITAHRKTLEKFAESPPESGCLILICDSFPGNTKLAKKVKAIGESLVFEPAKGKQLVSWIIQRCQQAYDKKISYATATSLFEHAGGSEASLDQELAKLSLFVGGSPEITLESVESLVGTYREQTIFAVLDAMADGSAKNALNEWRRVLATDRAVVGRAIAGLAWGVRRLLDARRRFDAGESVGTLARSLWTDPDVLTRRMQNATLKQREDQLLDLLAAEVAIKTGAATFGNAVERFIVKHSLARAS